LRFFSSDHPLEALFEIAPELRSGQHAAQVKRINPDLFEQVRHLPLPDILGQPFSHGRLSHTGIAHKNGVVFPAAAEHLHGAFHFRLAADQRIQPAFGRPVDQVYRVGFQRTGLFLDRFLFGRFGRIGRIVSVIGGDFMGDGPQHVQP
jgi:hypothetical protein